MTREEKLKDLIKKVEAWAEERNLLRFENADKQYLKFLEETGELARAILKNDSFEIIDSWGDSLVTVIILANQLKANLRMPSFCGKLVDPYMSIYEFVNLVSPNGVAEEVIDVMDLVSQSHGYDLVECLEVAYNVISKRKGKTLNGTFIKDGN
jgi:NTP pyrophosphatase (non-canonical NTP hydrolase)